MTYWAQLLHFYQPPTQTHEVLRRIAEESYRPLIAVLLEHPDARLAVNMNAVLTELLCEHGLGDIVQGLRALAEREQIEFVGSARYHAILPLITPAERRRQIEENERVNTQLFGPAFAPRGFFPPEMCYSVAIIPEVQGTGHRWLAMSGVACNAPWPENVVYRVRDGARELAVLFRDDVISNRIAFRETDPGRFYADLERIGGGHPAYVFTAMDAETFGHHIRGWERDFLGATYALVTERRRHHPVHPAGAEGVTMVTPSELVSLFPPGPVIEPFSSSWSTSRDDIVAGNPFPLWDAPGNRLHAWQWEYVGHTRRLLEIAAGHATSDAAKEALRIARERYEPALHSCQFWWASRRPMWSEMMIQRGFQLLNETLLHAHRAITAGDAPAELKQEARWRHAAANELRALIEREVFGEGTR